MSDSVLNGIIRLRDDKIRELEAKCEKMTRTLIAIKELATWQGEDEPDEDTMLDTLEEIHQLVRGVVP